jgi:hypothetical protein
MIGGGKENGLDAKRQAKARGATSKEYCIANYRLSIAVINVLDQVLGWIMKQDGQAKGEIMEESLQPTRLSAEDEEEAEERTEEGEEDDEWEDDSHLFPTHAAFTIPVEIKSTPRLGKDQYGVFAAEDIPANTEFWLWTHRVVEIPSSQVRPFISENYQTDDLEGIRTFLRRGFVLPPPYDDCFYSNPTDAGTFMNHSTTPNCKQPNGTSRLVKAGEELTMDYSGNGNPAWYVDICHRYGILTPVEIAEEENKRGGVVEAAVYDGPVGNSLLESMASLAGF